MLSTNLKATNLFVLTIILKILAIKKELKRIVIIFLKILSLKYSFIFFMSFLILYSSIKSDCLNFAKSISSTIVSSLTL